MKSMRTLSILILVFAVVSCAPEIANPVSVGFPLREAWVYKAQDEVNDIASTNDRIAVGTASDLSLLDSTTGIPVWSVQFPIPSGSGSLALTDDTVIAANFDKLSVFSAAGSELWSADLHQPDRGSAGIVSVSSQYVFVVRKVSWDLEAYDFKTGRLAWSAPIARGNSLVDFDPITGYVYVVTHSYIEVYDATIGGLLHTINGKFSERTFSDGILYYHADGDDMRSGYFAAYDLNAYRELWRVPFRGEVHSLAVFNGDLIAGMTAGVLAMNAKTGRMLWRSLGDQDVFAAPVRLDSYYFVKGALSKEIFALSMPTGSNAGYLRVERAVTFVQTDQDYRSGILETANQLVFATKDLVYAYGW